MMSLAAATALALVVSGGWFFGAQQPPDAGDTSGGTEEVAGANAVETPPGPAVKPPDTDLGGVNLLEENRDNVAGALGLADGGPNSIQLYGTVEPLSTTGDLVALFEEGEVYAALTFTSAVVQGADVVLEGEAVYARDSGDLVVHGQDFLAYDFAPGFFSGHNTADPYEYAPEEDEVVLVLSPEQPTGEFRLTFEGLPPRSLLEYVIEEENLNGGHPAGLGAVTMLKCVNAEDATGPGVFPAHQAGDCDLDWT